MKYIVYKIQDEEHAIVFPEHLIHKRIAMGLSTMDGIDRCMVVAAGFVHFPGHVKVTGHSESLNLRSRPEDTKIIQREYPLL